MIEVRQFAPEDLHALLLRPEVGALPLDWLGALAEKGPALTGLRDGKVIGCGGIALIDRTAGEGWCIMSREASRIGSAVLRCFARHLPVLQRDWGLRRVQVSVKTSDPTAVRFVRLLGFEPECVFSGPGAEFLRCARVA